MACQSESLQNLLASLRQQSPLPPIPALPRFHRGEVVEIQGPACSGKTHLLYHILLSLLVPVAPSSDSEIAAIVYDTDASFDIIRFRHLLYSRTSHESIRRLLARVHVFRPTSLPQLAASIANLSAYHSSHMPNQEIAVLAIDSISSFYWADRFATEQLRHLSPEKASDVPVLPLHHVFHALRAVWRSHRPLTVLTNWALNAAPPHSGILYKQHLHPFPRLEDGIAESGTEISDNIDHSSSSPFRLAHHISLSSPSSDAFPAPLPNEAHHIKGITDNRQGRGLTRSSGTRDAFCFAFQITDTDILVQPQQLV